MHSKVEETRKSMFTPYSTDFSGFCLQTCSVWRLLTVRALTRRYQAVYNYLPRNEDELELKEGDIVDVMEKCDDGWFVGELLILILGSASVVGTKCNSD